MRTSVPYLFSVSSASPWFVMVALAICGVRLQADLHAQGRGGQASPPSTAKAIAPIDLTGHWTAGVTEDLHVRIIPSANGDYGSVLSGTIENPVVGSLRDRNYHAAHRDIPQF